MTIRILVLGVLAGTLLVLALVLPADQATTAAESDAARPPMLWKRDARPHAHRKAAQKPTTSSTSLSRTASTPSPTALSARDATRKARNRVVFQAWMTLHDNDNQSGDLRVPDSCPPMPR